MAHINVENVSLELPVYNQHNSSFRSMLQGVARNIKLRKSKGAIIVNALSNISLTLKDGDRIGLIGLNGAGKTTLLRIISRIYQPTYGKVSVQGKISCILGTGFGMDEDATGYENIFLCGLYIGIPRVEMKKKVEEIIDFCELGEFIYLPIRTYSAGMRARLSFAIYTCYQPEILLIDEGIGAGDAAFLHKAQRRLEEFMQSSSILVLASHANGLIKQFCKQAILLEDGTVKKHGNTSEIINYYMDKING